MHTWKIEVDISSQCIQVREHESLTLDRSNREEQEGWIQERNGRS